MSLVQGGDIYKRVTLLGVESELFDKDVEANDKSPESEFLHQLQEAYNVLKRQNITFDNEEIRFVRDKLVGESIVPRMTYKNPYLFLLGFNYWNIRDDKYLKDYKITVNEQEVVIKPQDILKYCYFFNSLKIKFPNLEK